MRFELGFTLIEMMVVVVIIGILAAIAVPLYSKTVERTRIAEAVDILKAIRDAEMRYAMEFGDYSPGVWGSGSLQDLTDIEISGAGKYFDFETYGSGGDGGGSFAYPYDDDDDKLAVAGRLQLDRGVYGGYYIWINESGKVWALDDKVNKVLQQFN